ncbi:guanylate kinase [Thermodesulforhabdus norvegica]|uniref:Guanylate kinase n=1 Tax=Thermodesulforhabdus norvegica TaxID=39841 RepID=A0A1I4SC13_9BACT|nr:guanylate kinase [Thermodesulforhabdus norvegica]SFM62056.1 guanylate kinase [Thermodesulforhabdus norvegica]
MRKASLFVISAPSGCGKTTLMEIVCARIPRLKFSVSSTTRPPRPGEIHGVHYFFLTEEEFFRKVEKGEFLEWARVHDHYYGTDGTIVKKWLDEGYDVMLDIDVQGARQVKCLVPDAVTIFILPPSWEELERRLTERRTEPPDAIARRLTTARSEVAEAFWFDYLVVNDDVNRAASTIMAVIESARSRTIKSYGLIYNLMGRNP